MFLISYNKINLKHASYSEFQSLCIYTFMKETENCRDGGGMRNDPHITYLCDVGNHDPK